MKSPRSIVTALVVAVCVGTVGSPSAVAADGASTPTWVEQEPGLRPPVQGYHTLAYDSARERTVLFSGNCQCGSQTWEWDGETWTELDLAEQPPFRRFASMAFDEARGEVVLFGGIDPDDHSLTDTWVFDGASWAERTPAVSPPGGYHTPMAYDPTRAETMLYTEGQTWVWNGTKWKQRSPEHSPPPLNGYGSAFDEARDGVVLYGGRSSIEKFRKATWHWNGSDWRKLRNVGTIGANYNGGITAYDGRVMLFGGYPGTLPNMDETWVLGARKWNLQDVDQHPEARVAHAMVWDSAREQAVLFGGVNDGRFLNDTWVLRP
jgi:hypothetical protein